MLSTRSIPAIALLAAVIACGSETPATEEEEEATPPRRDFLEILAAGEPVFGMFSGDHTPEQGAAIAQNHELDFVFYSLESGPFDMPAMAAYMEGMSSSGSPTHPLILRIPPIRDGVDAARGHIRQGLANGVRAIVYPHVTSRFDATVAVSEMGDDVWPTNAAGSLASILIIEDQEGIANAREIVSTPGVSVAIPGPGDLRRAYDRDMEAVENAIQTVLGLCLEFEVPCGITAGVDDIGERIEQGFRFFIVTQPEAVAAGRAAWSSR